MFITGLLFLLIQPSVEVRLARTLASMRNVRNMLEDSNISNEGKIIKIIIISSYTLSFDLG